MRRFAITVGLSITFGAGLVATGVAAVAATHRRQAAAATGTDTTSADPELPAV